MADPAKELFEVYLRQVPEMAADAARSVRAILGTELVKLMSPEQHRRLNQEMEARFKLAVGDFLGPFNNVCCVLTGPVIGFSLLARYSPDSGHVAKEIGRDGMDYVEMWRDFIHTLPSARHSDSAVSS